MERTPSIPFSISWLARLFRTRFDARARTLCLTRSQWSMIAAISIDQGSTQSELASRLEINSVTAGRIIDKLDAGGWIERRVDPADRRANRLYLKDTAGPLFAKLARLGADEEKVATQGMSPAELQVLAGLLKRMLDNLNGTPPPEAVAGGNDLVVETDFG